MDNLSSEYWDCIIVGAGILGCSTAKYLIEQHPNWKILLVDKFLTAGQGNTIKSNAAYRNIFDTELNIQISRSSVQYYKSIEKQGIDVGLKEIGYLWLLSKSQFEYRTKPNLFHPDNPNKKISFLEFLELEQIPIKVYSKKELSELIPELQLDFLTNEMNVDGIDLQLENIEYGLQGIECGSLSPDLLVNHYLSEFKKLGGYTSFRTLVKEVLLKERGKDFDPDYKTTVWRKSEIGGIKVENLETKKEYILTGKKVLLATGAWINQLLNPLGIQTPINPKKRQLFRILGMDSFVKKDKFNAVGTFPFLILPVGGIFVKPILEARAIDVGCSDDIGRRFEISSPREEPTNNPILDNPTGEQEFYALNLEPILCKYFPSVFDKNLLMEKPSAGMYAYSLDKFPVIDKISDLNNLYFVSGASGSGIMKADSIARICVGLIEEKPSVALYNGYEINVSDFSLSKRNLPKETLVL